MERIKKIFGGIELTWKKLIIFAIIAGAYTAIMAMLPIAKDTSFVLNFILSKSIIPFFLDRLFYL